MDTEKSTQLIKLPHAQTSSFMSCCVSKISVLEEDSSFKTSSLSNVAGTWHFTKQISESGVATSG